MRSGDDVEKAGMAQDGLETEQTPVSPEEARSELEVILRSPAFDRSERLQKFLRYICELTLNGEGARINEYLIGSEVFAKGSDYNPNEDSIVRRQAHALRRKLQDYYTGEGKNRLIRIELPVGRYVPTFRRLDLRPVTPSVEVVAPAPTPAESSAKPTSAPVINVTKASSSRVHIWPLTIGSLMIFTLGIAAGTLWMSGRASQQRTAPIGPAAQEIWKAWTTGARGAVICLSNPNLAVVKRLARAPSPEQNPPRFPVDASSEAILRNGLGLPAGGKIYFTPAKNMAKMGEAVAGVLLGRFLTLAGPSVTVTQSRFVNWEDMRKENLIVLGNNESNQWVDPLLKKCPFRLGSTDGSEPRSIMNTAPAAGEQPVYKIAYSGSDDEADQEYALVSMIAGLESEHQLLLINGLNTQATQMATEYLTSETTLKELAGRLRTLSSGSSGPWHFQAVLKTEVYDKVPTHATLVTVRLLK